MSSHNRSESVKSYTSTEIEILHHQIGFFKIKCKIGSTIGDICNQIKTKYPNVINDNLVLIKDGKILRDKDLLPTMTYEYLVCYTLDRSKKDIKPDKRFVPNSIN